jgi:tRNA(Ile)-lysidine synthase
MKRAPSSKSRISRRRRSSGKAAPRGDAAAPVSAAEAKRLFMDLQDVPSIVLAVSGGPDSVALMALAAHWCRTNKRSPKLVAVTVDHGLRSAAAIEARDVKKLAAALGVEHHTLRWRGVKPKTGLPAAARAARYRLLAGVARDQGSVHVLTAHTQDDQAETVLMRLSRGSGLAGLSAMARQSVRDGIILVRPFLGVPKSRLVATLQKAGIAFATDPTNEDKAFKRPRLRALMPELAREGFDARSLARFAVRAARANAALETVVDAAERALTRVDSKSLRFEFDAETFFAAPGEIRLRLLLRAIDRAGLEGPAELGKAEALLEALDDARKAKKPALLKRTLAGAIVGFNRNLIFVSPAPPRRVHRGGGLNSKP